MTAPPVILDARVIANAGGGPDKTILNSPRFLTPAGYRMLCVYLRPPGLAAFDGLRRTARRLDAPLIEIDDRGAFDRGVFTNLLAVCRREKVAVWHGHDYKTNLLGILLSHWWPMRLVTTAHGWVEWTPRTALYFLLDRLTLRCFERVIAVSPDLADAARRAGVPPRRVILLENGIDLDEYRRTQAAVGARTALGLPPRLTVGAAGRLSPEKGFLSLVRAADRLWRAGHDFTLVILGEGGQRAEIQALVGSLHRADRVVMPGRVIDVRPWFEAMDLFALSSLREGLPNVLLEAMAMGVPAAATRIAGVPRLVRDGESGLLVAAGDEIALASALGKLLNDRDLRGRLAAAGRRTVEAGYSFARRMTRLAELYDELLGRPPLHLPVNDSR